MLGVFQDQVGGSVLVRVGVYVCSSVHEAGAVVEVPDELLLLVRELLVLPHEVELLRRDEI